MYTIHDLDTPSLIVDMDVMDANLVRLQKYCDQHGIGLRPHIKTHKIPALAQKQVDLGAVGIACQKLGEAEVMVDAGLQNIMIPYNIIGRHKLERLTELARRAQVTVSVDSMEVARPMGEYLDQQGLTVKTVIELTSELNRCGVTTAESALDLARGIHRTRGLEFHGVMVYPSSDRSMQLVGETVNILQAESFPVDMISGGGSPTAFQSHEFHGLTEIRAGTYIFNDSTYLRKGICTLEQCALKVIVTVISAPTLERVIIDGGTKTFSSDMGTPMGTIVEYPDAQIYQMSEEHGFVDITRCSQKPRIGERLTVIPNHACGTINMHDRLIGLRDGTVETQWEIAARGKIQ
jgi:D-serine deaminase-like pyridoxal phosphate-dependent protein